MSIKYKPGGNFVGFFANNVFRPTAQVLSGLDWEVQPPKFTRCPKDAVATPAPGKVASCCPIQLLIVLLVIVGFIS